MTPPTNLFAGLTTHLPQELVTTLLEAKNLRVERIVSQGHASPAGFWFDQDQDEWVVLLAGAARLRFDNQPQAREIRPGDFLTIPAHQRHQVEWTTPDEPTVWLAIHFDAETS